MNKLFQEIVPGSGHSPRATLLLFLSAFLAAVVTPFTIVRVQDRQWAIAWLDISLVGLMIGLFIYVFVTRRTRVAEIIMAVVFAVGTLLSVYLLGISQVYWAFPAVIAVFFILDSRHAAILWLLAYCAIVAILWDSQSPLSIVSICLTLLISIVLAYLFALITQRQNRQLQHFARIDPLTGAGNRRAQDEKLEAVCGVCSRHQLPASVLMLDLDHFKRINDTHGHIIGDRVLVEVAVLIHEATRATENLYRYGGEEFALIAEHTALEGAVQLAERLRRLIEGNAFASGISVTVSIGVAELQPEEERREWLNRADSALLKAKDEGRNRVVLAKPRGELNSMTKVTDLPELS